MTVAFVCMAAAATLLRALLTADQEDLMIPWRTLAVNTVGSLVLGVMIGAGISDQVVLTSAGLGSLTTFSTVAAETATLLDRGERKYAASYLCLTVVIGIIAALVGLSIGEIA